MPHLRIFSGLLVLSSLSGCAGGAPAAQAPVQGCATPSPELEKLDEQQLARRMIEVTLGKNLGQQMMDAMTESLRKLPGLAPGFMDRFRANLNVDDLVELVVPLYVKNYDRETMIAAIQFYESEQGRKLVGKMPEVTRQAMEAGQQWGRQVAQKTLTEMAKENPPPQ